MKNKIELDIFEVKVVLNLLDTARNIDEFGLGIEELCLRDKLEEFVKNLEKEKKK